MAAGGHMAAGAAMVSESEGISVRRYSQLLFCVQCNHRQLHLIIR